MFNVHLFLLVSCLWLLSSAIAPAIIDSNDNGMSDLWEQHFNNEELFPESFDPTADPDGDGWSNLQEATAGTDPDRRLRANRSG